MTVRSPTPPGCCVPVVEDCQVEARHRVNERVRQSEMNRPETIEETAALVDEAGGRGIAVQVDHLVPDEVGALVARIEAEQGALHVLVNDIWGATTMEWDKSVWESSLEIGPRTLRLGELSLAWKELERRRSC